MKNYQGKSKEQTMLNINKSIDIAEHVSVLAIVSAIGLVSNYTSTGVDILTALPGMLILYIIVISGLIVSKIVPFYLPSIAWISIIAVGITLPVSPVASIVLLYVKKVGFLPLTTPVLAYTGLAIARREIATFKSSGWKIVTIGILVFIGTYIGSAFVAEMVLKVQGII